MHSDIIDDEDGKYEWRRIKNGITQDSGSAVDIMPEGMLSHIPIRPCSGPRKGRRMVAANGTPIAEVGERRVLAVSDSGADLDWTFIAGDVRKILKSTATTCDEDKWMIFTKTGGWIVDLKTRKRIPFNRVGNTYAMDAWVRVLKEDESGWNTVNKRGKSSGFTRPSGHP